MLDLLRGELERLYDLDELRDFVATRLELDVSDLQHPSAKAAVADALVARACRCGAVQALADLVVCTRPQAAPGLRELQRGELGSGDDHPNGARLGPFTVQSTHGSGGLSQVCVARDASGLARLRVLKCVATADQGSVQRYLLASRLSGELEHRGLPRNVRVVRWDGGLAVASDHEAGEPLSRHLGRPVKPRFAWPILRSVLEALCALHGRRIVHGALHPDNVLVCAAPESPAVSTVLLDTGTHHLRQRALVGGAASGRAGDEPLRHAAPEQLLGELPSVRSDLYSFGLVLYAMLSGRPAFRGAGRELAKARFCTTPEPLSFVAPRGWILPELDELVLQLLDSDPERRPPDAEAVLEMLEVLAVRTARSHELFPDESFDMQLMKLLDAPDDDVAAALLEHCIEQGASAARVAEGFVIAAEQLGSDEASVPARCRLLARAAELYDGAAADPKAAALAWRGLLKLEPHDEPALAAAERALRRAGDYQGLVELLVEHSRLARTRAEEARDLSKVGDLLSAKLDDPEEAMVAYVHAFLAEPAEASHARSVERLAGADKHLWTEVLETCARAVMRAEAQEGKSLRLVVMGGWYRDKLGRIDVAAQCFQAVLQADPKNDAALEAMAGLYRNAGQWREFSELLLARASAASMPAQARDFTAEAAEVMARYELDVPQATDLLEQVLKHDPSHARATQTLCELYLGAGKLSDYGRVMKQRAAAAPPAERRKLLHELARALYERKGSGVVELLEELVRQDPGDVESLRKLEEAYLAEHRYDELLGNLEQQLEQAVTPRQKALLLERMAALHLQEFLDRNAAAGRLEQLLDLEPGHAQALHTLAHVYRELRQWAALAWTLERQATRIEDPEARADKLLELGALAAEELKEPAFAIDAYERVRQLRPGCAQALEALAALRATEGDQAGAAEAFEARADAEPDPERRAGYLVRAADLLSLRGDASHAVELYRRALDAAPSSPGAARGLYAAYLARNEVEMAVQCLELAMGRTESVQEKADLSALMARTLVQRAGQLTRAHAAAAFAIELDPNHVPARVLLADLERRAGSFPQARERYAAIESSIRALPESDRAEALCGYAQCLAHTGEPQQALLLVREVLERHGEHRELLRSASDTAFVAGDFALAAELAGRLVQQHGRLLAPAQLAAALWQRGESLSREGKLDDAVAPLERAASLDTAATEPLRALASIYRSQEQWVPLSQAMIRLLDRVQGDARVALLLEIGELAEGVLDDPTLAGRSYLTALAERPADRKILLTLARFYSAERDWAQLVEAVVRLVELTAEPEQKSRYLRTAARVAQQELGDPSKAAELLDRALQLAPADRVLEAEALELRTALGDAEALERLYRDQLAAALQRSDRVHAQQLAIGLAQWLQAQSREQSAIEVLEAQVAQWGPEPEADGMLLQLYAADPVRYLDRSVRFARGMIAQAPLDPQGYQVLRRMYADARRRDATWVACQALSVLGAADAKEGLYFKRYGGGGPLPAQVRLGEQDWHELVVHPQVDGDLTRVFRILQPVVARARGRSLQELGLSESSALDPSACSGTLVKSLLLASRALGIPMPLLFENPKAATALTMTSCARPALVLASSALRDRLPEAGAAFVAAAHLTYLRPGFYLRSFVPKLALKAWLLAAIRLTAQPLPADPEIEGLAREAQAILDGQLSGNLREHLAEPVMALLRRGGKLSVSRWMEGVDMTSDRAGLVVGGELPAAVSVVKASAEGAAVLPTARRIGALLQYSVSSEYLTLRDRLRLSVDWAHSEELPLARPQAPPA